MSEARVSELVGLAAAVFGGRLSNLPCLSGSF